MLMTAEEIPVAIAGKIERDAVQPGAQRGVSAEIGEAAMRPDSRLLIIEAILPERARDRPAAIRMDLHMLLLLGARERTETEFRMLLKRSGFRLERLVPIESPAGLGVMEAVLG